MRYTEDKFPDHDILLGYLSREAAHLQKFAITSGNHHFRYQGRQLLHGTPVLMFAVQPGKLRKACLWGALPRRERCAGAIEKVSNVGVTAWRVGCGGWI